MRTEIVKIIEALITDDMGRACDYVEKLKENYHKLNWNDEDRLFIKRILNLFHPDGEYSSDEVIMDME